MLVDDRFNREIHFDEDTDAIILEDEETVRVPPFAVQSELTLEPSLRRTVCISIEDTITRPDHPQSCHTFSAQPGSLPSSVSFPSMSTPSEDLQLRGMMTILDQVRIQVPPLRRTSWRSGVRELSHRIDDNAPLGGISSHTTRSSVMIIRYGRGSDISKRPVKWRNTVRRVICKSLPDKH